MAKITRCDRCGKEEFGRNPEGFSEAMLYGRNTEHPSGYIDLCTDCRNLYDSMYDATIRKSRNEFAKWLNESFIQNLKGDI